MMRTTGKAVLLLAVTVFAPTPAEAKGPSDFDSAALYRASCAPCHGPTGMGGGPVAAALKRPLPMIATLSRRNGGTFPRDHVYQVIDGRKEVAAHGSRVMPVWGAVFGATHHGAGGEHSTKGHDRCPDREYRAVADQIIWSMMSLGRISLTGFSRLLARQGPRRGLG